MSSITKGEWKILGDLEPIIAVTDSKNPKSCDHIRQVCEVKCGGFEVPDYEESKKNAFLIASSPKLLKHLKTMHVCYTKGIQPSVGTLKEIEALLQELK